MSAEVKNVSEVVKGVVQEVKDTATQVADRLRKKSDEAKLALGMVDQFGDELGKATSELRGLLGISTNNPPPEPAPEVVKDAEGKKGWLK